MPILTAMQVLQAILAKVPVTIHQLPSGLICPVTTGYAQVSDLR